MMPKPVLRVAWLVVCGTPWIAGPRAAAAAPLPVDVRNQASEFLRATGVRGGVIVHLGCGDGRLTAAFARDGYMVQGLATDEKQVRSAREFFSSLHPDGKVTAEGFDGQHLPYLDNYVNLLVGRKLASVPQEEVLRVLVPGGVAYLRGDSGWQKAVKPPRKDTDEWTHYLHDASNNAVAHDTVVSPPKYLQWMAEPEWSRTHSHMGSMMGLVSAGGRVFAIADEGSVAYPNNPARWSLCARDAYNGVLLWRVPIPRYQDHMWPLKNGPAQLPRRLVAGGGRVYATLDINGPVSAIDAATGKILYSCKPSTGTEEILLSDGVLFLLVNPKRRKGDPPEPVVSLRSASSRNYGEYPKAVMAVEASSGKVLWQHATPVLPMTLAADERRVYLHNGEKICALDRKTGSQLWTTPPVACVRPILANYSPTLIVYRDVVVFMTRREADKKAHGGTTSAFDAATGKRLWTVDGSGSSSSSPASLFGIGGLVWYGDVGGGGRTRQITGLDLLTGKTRQTIVSDTDILNYHARCYRNKATDKYFLSNVRGVEFVDLARKHWDVNLTMRGGCSFGIMPAHGMTYMTPHPCTCYIEARLNGFYAAYGDSTPARRQAPAPVQRLTKGPAYDAVVSPAPNPRSPAASDEWPVFRHDNARSGGTQLDVPAKLKPAWQWRSGRRLSALTVAGGKVFAAAIDAHTLYALDSASGKVAWSFLADGRIDSPPTIYRGRIYFGCADGCVYCLRAADGALAWKFLAAANDRQLLSNGQFESVHPLHGSVLIEKDILYCMAGRSMFLDGGLRFYRLDPLTGTVVSLSVLNEVDPTTGKNLQEKVKEQTLPPALPDILSSDGTFLYLRSQRFTLDGRRPEIAARSKKSADLFAIQKGPTAHLFARGGFLEDSGFHRLFWTYGKVDFGGHQGDPFSPPYTPTGTILAFNNTDVFGYAGRYKGGNIRDALFSISRNPRVIPDPRGAETPGKEKKDKKDKNEKREKKTKRKADKAGQVQPPAAPMQLQYNWKKTCRTEVAAIALAGDVLFAATDPEEGDPKLLAYAIKHGQLLAEQPLPAAPAFDGMAIAQGRLYLTLKDGSVQSFAPAKSRP